MRRTLIVTVAACGLLLGTAGLTGTASSGPPAVRGSSQQQAVSAAAGHWQAAGHLLVTRDHPRAVVLLDGRVLVVGGTAVRSKSAELYNPATGTSTVADPTNVVRFDPSMVRLPDGRVLLAGGRNLASGRPVRATEIYDPTSGTWHLVAPMNHPRFGAAIAVLSNGRVLVAGGAVDSPNGVRAVRSAEIYRPRQNRWVSTTPMRWRHASFENRQSLAVLRNGDALIAGSVNGDSGDTKWAERYDVSRHVWVPAGVVGYRSPGLIRLHGGQVLAVGGVTLGYSPRQHDPVARYLPRRNRWVSDPPLPRSFLFPGLVMVGGRPLAVGECDGVQPARPCPAVARYQPDTRTWVTAAPLPDSRQNFATVRLPDRTVLVIAGTYRPPMTEANPISSVLRWSAP